ncbi:MAG: hypothetical protein ACR2MS_07935 [Weeksellaceae bacterium]
MSDSLESLLADLLMEEEKETFEDRFLKFIIMERYIRKLREDYGWDNKRIYNVCLELDNEKQNNA